jgi:NitT/TauT family transport system permease protein
MKRRVNFFGLILTLSVLTALWSLAALLVNRPFLPGPAAALRALIRLAASGALYGHLSASLSRIVLAMLTSSIPAAAIGLAAGRSPLLSAFLSPVIYLVHPLPKAAFLPLILLIFGLGEFSKVFLIGFIIFSQIMVTARDAAARIPEELVDSVRSMGGGRADLWFHVIVPAALPDLFTGFRVSLGAAAAVLFLAETFAADKGLGYLIIDAWTRVAYGEMYAAILSLSLLALGLFAALDAAESLLCRWRG